MIRAATPADVPAIAKLIRDLAEYERITHTVVFREADLRNHLFGERRYAEAKGGPLKDLLGDYHEAYMAQVSQSVACNGLHRLEQRCCRWLLMTRDRVGSDELRLTHEYLGIMLGARRASVTDVLAPLQEAALVRSHRGTISILDRAGVEARSCECYHVVKEEYDRLLGRTE
jgi:CRP-like cAMP-binding protein